MSLLIGLGAAFTFALAAAFPFAFALGAIPLPKLSSTSAGSSTQGIPSNSALFASS